jgi:RNA polymerase sigma factor (sigma-70 family)
MTASDRDALVLTHLPLVHQIAGSLARRLPSRLDRRELESAGAVGLMEAAQRFRPSGGASFRTFAGHRVRGAMLDQMREQAPLTRAEYQRTRDPEAAYLAPCVVFDSAKVVDHPALVSWTDPIVARRLRDALTSLRPRRYARLIVWRYWHGLTHLECARRLGVNESRASQIERAALDKLRRALDRW